MEVLRIKNLRKGYMKEKRLGSTHIDDKESVHYIEMQIEIF